MDLIFDIKRYNNSVVTVPKVKERQIWGLSIVVKKIMISSFPLFPGTSEMTE